MTTPIPRRQRPQQPPPFVPVYSSYAEFYEEELRFMFPRMPEYDGAPVDGNVAWCPQWRLHTDAVARVRALWMAWESANVKVNQDPVGDGNAMAGWWVNYADPMMRELFDPAGTFKGCTIRNGHKTPDNGGNGPLPGEPVTP